jgi:hypothetical protein
LCVERKATKGRVPEGGLFRCVQAEYIERDDTIAITAETASALVVRSGDDLYALALARHTRL